MHKLTAGDGYTYLTRQVAVHDSTERGHGGLADYYTERGESPGRWLGDGLRGLGIEVGEPVTAEQMRALFGEGRHPNASAVEAAAISSGGTPERALAASALGHAFRVYAAAGEFQVQLARAFTAHNLGLGLRWDAPIDPAVRARLRTDLAAGMFSDEHGRPPADARELAGFIARSSRRATSAVAGYDLTFTPVKSVSTLWAVAPREVAQQIEAAHHAAVMDTLAWVERGAAYTRVGRNGARQVDVRGLIAVAFTHRDSRAGDPDLHTHVAVANKAQEAATGRWLALDGRVLYKAKVAASERYNTRLEAELIARLGVRFVDRCPAAGQRPVRELDGVDLALGRHWSRRRASIEGRYAELAVSFQNQHGRPPTAVEALALKQRANLETRDAKHEPRSEADQREHWATEARAVLGDDAAVAAMVAAAVGRSPSAARVNRRWVRDTADLAIRTLEAGRATWQVWHVRAEAERQARATGVPLSELDTAVDRVVRRALTRCSLPLATPDPIPEPRALRRRDGTSVYDLHGARSYTSTRILHAEHRLLRAAGRSDGRAVSDVRVAAAVARCTNDTRLNDAQATMVRELATSGRRVQVALAPAGTGKTTAMRVLAHAWADAGGHVVALAPSAQAAHELGQAIGARADTLTKLTWTITHTPAPEWPGWIAAIDATTLVIVDEAGQAGSVELAAAVDFVLNRGGSVRLVGDDQQLAAVAAGGILRDLVHTHGAATLSEVRRFADSSEAAATLAVREGDPSALGFYADHDRIHVGDLASVTDQAYAAWAADRADGRESLLLAPTRDLATALNERARLDRLSTTDKAMGAVTEVRLCDGSSASVGDTVITRRNDRRLAHSPSDWVRNGDRWVIEGVLRDGSLRVRHLRCTRRSVVLTTAYVAKHVQLGYASTVHAAQGMTVDTTHAVLSGNESRQLLYVAVTRGRSANHLYLANAFTGDPHDTVRPEAVLPPTAIETLTSILERDGAQQSASTLRRTADSPAALLHEAVQRYTDSVALAAEHHLGTDKLACLDDHLDALVPGITAQPAYATLRTHLALLAADGRDPHVLAAEAVAERELETADDPAAVLDSRLSCCATGGPLPWLPGVPAALRGDREWGTYLHARAARVAILAGQVRNGAASWSATQAPQWARHLTRPEHADLRGRLAVWRAAFDIPETDQRPTGPAQLGRDAEDYRWQLRRLHRAATGIGSIPVTTWAMPDEVTSDAHAAFLVNRLSALERAGIAVQPLIDAALGDLAALPTEVPADALWWRIAGHLGPAALRATAADAHALRPGWTGLLAAQLGEDTARRVIDAPAWPALVAAVHAAPNEWTPEMLVTTVIDSVAFHRPGTLSDDELCDALVWRVALLTDPPPDIEPPTGAEDPTASPGVRQAQPGIAVARIVELNRLALDFYVELYPRSWAPDYLRDRLGTDLRDVPQYAVGYAPPGPRSLTSRLERHGVSEKDLIEAGLARRTNRGDVVDSFGDRLIVPLYRGDDLVGFIGRRNPTKDDTEYAGPKYLNTRATRAFHKGEVVYGLTEGQGALDAGARPVLVEGPLDAIAITLATEGAAVGVAPLGTAFTSSQAKQLRPLLRGDPSRIIVATDNDLAGREASHRAFWTLSGCGSDPQHVVLPDGADPADLLRTRGREAVLDSVRRAKPLASTLIDDVLGRAGDLASPASQEMIVRDASAIIAALPPALWLDHIDRLTHDLGVAPGLFHLGVIEAAQASALGGATPNSRAQRTALGRPQKWPVAGPHDHPSMTQRLGRTDESAARTARR